MVTNGHEWMWGRSSYNSHWHYRNSNISGGSDSGNGHHRLNSAIFDLKSNLSSFDSGIIRLKFTSRIFQEVGGEYSFCEYMPRGNNWQGPRRLKHVPISFTVPEKLLIYNLEMLIISFDNLGRRLLKRLSLDLQSFDHG